MGQMLHSSSHRRSLLFLSAIRLNALHRQCRVRRARNGLNGFIRDDILYHLRGHQMPPD